MDQPAHILVVDDDPALRWTTARILQRAGYRVDAAETGEEGLQLAREGLPDVILLDVVLPGLDGLEVCRRIKADPDLSGAYVLLYSATRVDTLEQADGLEVGADGYITRPVSNRELLARVEAILRLKHAEGALRVRTEELARRVRELDCLYGITRLSHLNLSLPDILAAAVNLLPPAWRYPEVACACLQHEGRRYASIECQSHDCDGESGCRSFARISASIVTHGQPSGSVGVCYTEPQPEADEGPFSEAERQLIDVLAGQLGRLIERVRAEEALHSSEEKFRSVFQQSHDGITLVDGSGTIVEWNRAMERHTGRPAASIVGRPLWDVQIELFPDDGLAPGSREAVRAEVLEALETGQVGWLAAPGEWTYHHPDGSVRALSLTNFRIETPQGFFLGGVVRDVTQRRNAEAALTREAGINAASAALASALIHVESIDDISHLVLEHARNLTSSAHGFAGYIDPTQGRLVVPTMTGEIWDRCEVEGRTHVFEHFHGLWGWVIEHREPLLTNDPDQDPRAVGTPRGHIPIRRFLAVPAVVNDVLVGEIALVNADHDYTTFDLELVERLASLYAVAIQRSRTEEALRSSEVRFRSLLESAPDAIFLVDTDGRIVFANVQAEESFGYVRAELLGQPIEVLVPERMRDTHRDRRAKYGTGSVDWPRVAGQALQARRKDGSHFPADVKLAPLMMDGELLVTASVRDVSEREEARVALQRAHDELEARVQARTAELAAANSELREEISRRRDAEQALRASEARFRQIAANIDEALWMTDAETGEFLYVSPIFQEMAGMHAERISADPTSLVDAVHPEDRERVAGTLSDRRGPIDLEFRLQRDDGSVRWIRTRSFPIHDQLGRVYRIAGLAQDITTERQAQGAMIQNERLAMAGKLAASLAHEINNPLQSAIGCLDLVEDSLATGQDPGPFLTVVQQELERTARIVAQLHTLSRPAVPVNRTQVDLNELIGQVLLLAGRQVTSSAIRILWNLVEDLPRLLLSADEMRQVLLNLVLNAVDAMPEGGTLEVWTARADPDGVVVKFVDNGGGISPSAMKELFDPFYSTKPDGLGLGLFITQNIVRAHGGSISVESEAGAGATFTVWLPLDPVKEDETGLDPQDTI